MDIHEMWTSGMSETTVLTWWGDCENEDMRWDLTPKTTATDWHWPARRWPLETPW